MNEKKLSIRVYEPLLNAFQEYCKQHNLTQSEVIRDQIKELLNFQTPDFFEQKNNIKDFHYLIIRKIWCNIELSLNDKYNILIQARKVFWDNYLIRDNTTVGLNSPEINYKSGLIFLNLLEKLSICNCGISKNKLEHEINLFSLAALNNQSTTNEQGSLIKILTELKCKFNSKNSNIIWPIVLEGLHNILILCKTPKSLMAFTESFNQVFDLLIYPVFCLNFKDYNKSQEVNLSLPQQIMAGTVAMQSDYIKDYSIDEIPQEFSTMINKYYSSVS